jgi:glyoxylase-like metal-dependent hydrolase (beta-lactamase superfamily II)
VLIDAPGGIWALVEPILAREKCRLVELWLTHGHWDHIQDAAKVVRASGAQVRGHIDDRHFFETPEIMSAFLSGRITLEKVTIDHWVAQGDRFEVLGRTVEVRHVPGHCPGNVLFYFADVGAAFVGDALFAGSVGRTDLPGGNHSQLMRVIREQIYTLPDETKVYPGHGPATTVGGEKRANPHVRG